MALVTRDEAFPNELADYAARISALEDKLARQREDLQKLRQEVIFDVETTLYSPAYFQNRLREEVLRAERYRHFLSLILIHVETANFTSTQEINREMRKVGLELMAGFLRRTDIIAVFAKRQVVVLLPETDARGLENLMQRCQSMPKSQGHKLTSLALTYPNDASNTEMALEKLRRMSENLYRGTEQFGQ